MVDWVNRLERWMLMARGFQSQWIDTSSGSMHVFDSKGSGEHPPLVVLHGISACATQFRPLLTPIRSSVRRVIAPDLAGHGFSAAPKSGLNETTMMLGLEQTLGAVIDEPFVMVGNSLGGLAAIRFALAHPDRVKGLILISPGGAPMAEDDFQAFLGNFRQTDRYKALAFLDKLTVAPMWYRQLIASGVAEVFCRPAMAKFLAEISSDNLLSAGELSTLTMPIRLIWGKQDHLMPRENLQFFRSFLPPHAVTVEPDGFGHCPYMDTPSKLVHVVNEALDGLVQRLIPAIESPSEPERIPAV